MIKKVVSAVLAISVASYAGSTVKLKSPPEELDKYYPPNS